MKLKNLRQRSRPPSCPPRGEHHNGGSSLSFSCKQTVTLSSQTELCCYEMHRTAQYISLKTLVNLLCYPFTALPPTTPCPIIWIGSAVQESRSCDFLSAFFAHVGNVSNLFRNLPLSIWEQPLCDKEQLGYVGEGCGVSENTWTCTSNLNFQFQF